MHYRVQRRFAPEKEMKTVLSADICVCGVPGGQTDCVW